MNRFPKIFLIIGLSAISILAGCDSNQSNQDAASVAPASSADLSHRKGALVIHAEPGSVVHVAQLSHEFWFGGAITSKAFDGRLSEQDNARYRAAFLENFNSAVTENALKWLDMQPLAGPVDYETVNAILEWTDENGLPLRGHNIYWGIPKFVQPWVKDLDDEALYAELKNRGEDIAKRYKGRFAQYDLNNEMIHGNYYEDRLGDTITLEMAQWIKAVDPEAELYLNDYDILTGARLGQFVEHIETLLSQGVPLSGIGVQGHLHTDTFDRSVLKSSLDRLAGFGLPIVVTEFNFPGQRSKYHKEKGVHPFGPEEELVKAQAIEDYYRISFGHPGVDGILMWGFWAGENWIPESSLYNEDWSPTPALKAYQDLVYKEWWTDIEVEVGESGTIEVPAFYGDYTVTSDGVDQKVELRKEAGSAQVSF